MNQVTDVTVKAIEWRDNKLHLLDQRCLPVSENYLVCEDVDAVIEAIRLMVVRGAPAIGIAAAYGVVLSARQHYRQETSLWHQTIQADLDRLANARPTAVNLAWAVDRMRRRIAKLAGTADPVAELIKLADLILAEDIQANRTMGEFAADVMAENFQSRFSILTHCNAGSLATGGYGTALGAIRSAWQRGMIETVYADETRPWLQGSRLTAWELQKSGIPVTLNADGAAAWLMRNRSVSWVIVGADRITANGDVANKIGTYHLAIAARYHGVKVMVVAPSGTIDMSLADGQTIEIEMRDQKELTAFGDYQTAPANTRVVNPVFDVTPAELVDVIVTEKGVIKRPCIKMMRKLFL